MTLSIIKGCLIGIAYLLTGSSYGIALSALARIKKPDFTRTLISGMFFYALCFAVFVIPLKLSQVPLHTIVTIWGWIWVITVVLFFLLLRGRTHAWIRRFLREIAENRWIVLFLFLFTLVQIVFNIFYGRWSSSDNPSNYVAYVTTAMFTDSLGTTDPRSGILHNNFDYKLLTQTFLDHSAVVSSLFRVHPLIEIRYIIPFLFFITGNLVVYMLAKAIFPGSHSRQGLFFCVYQFIVALTTNTFMQMGFYIYFRNYEGKNEVTALAIPIMFYVIWKLYENPKDRETLWFGVLCNIGAYTFTSTIMFLAPVSCLAFIPGFFKKESRKPIFWDAFWLILPHVLYALYYVAAMRGYIRFPLR